MTNWDYSAGVVWPLLTNAAKKRTTITYGDIAPKIRTIPVAVGSALGPIQDFCLENRLPPLTAIVVREDTGKPGAGFIAWDIDDWDTAKKAVFGFDWRTVRNPYGGFGPQDSVENLGKKLAKNPSQGKAIYRLVKDRGIFQKIFRMALIELYGKCSMCGLTFEDALDAAHIVPWSKCDIKERADVRNGLMLCATHHRLFDRDWIAVSEKLKIEYSDPEMTEEPYSKIDQLMSTQLHGKSIYLPEQKNKWPLAKYLKQRATIKIREGKEA